MDDLKIEQSSAHPLVVECQHALLDQVWVRCALPRNGQLLDIGPGRGLYTRYFLDRGFQVDCVDIDPAMRQTFVELGCDFKVADLRSMALPFEEERFDFVWCSHVIEHLPDVHRFACELFRVVKPGGYVILRTPDLASFGWDFWHDPTHLHPFIKVALEKILLLGGFENVFCSNCELPAIKGLHRIRAYRWAPAMLFWGANLIGVGRRPA
jgi:SAM-dependent methyltransferase